MQTLFFFYFHPVTIIVVSKSLNMLLTGILSTSAVHAVLPVTTWYIPNSKSITSLVGSIYMKENNNKLSSK